MEATQGLRMWSYKCSTKAFLSENVVKMLEGIVINQH